MSYDDVLFVYNEASQMSIDIKNYFMARRTFPAKNICNISTSTAETVSRTVFTNEIRAPIESCIVDGDLLDIINFIITTKGVPLRVSGSGNAAVDSELTMILGPLNNTIGRGQWTDSPYYGEDEPFSHAKYGTYIVTRFTAYTFAEVQRLIDDAGNSTGSRGLFQMDAGGPYASGDQWIATANQTMVDMGFNVTHDTTNTFTMHHKDVMGHISWGSNGRGYGSNFVPNSGFETDADVNGIPDGWTIVNDGGTWARSADTASSGTYSAKIDRPGVTAGASEIFRSIDILPDTRYYLTGSANLSGVSADDGAHLFMRAYDSQDQLVATLNAAARTGTRNWYSMSQVHYEPYPDVSRVEVGAALSQSSGIAYFDNVALHVIRPNNTWVPGSIGETFVSTGGRSFTYGTAYGQSLVADMVREGISGISGHVYEPFLTACGRPQILFPRYVSGYSMGESFAMSLPWIGWMEVIVGDPKMAPYWDVPDPMVVNMTMSPEDPAVGEEVTFTAEIMNRGETVSNANVQFFLGNPAQGNQIGTTTTIPTLARDETKFIEAKHTFDDAFIFSIYVVVDKDDLIKEQRESNNVFELAVQVNSKPDLEITPLDIVFSTDDLVQGDIVSINITAHNNGGVDTNMTVDLTITEPLGTMFTEQLVFDPALAQSSMMVYEKDLNTSGMAGNLCVNVSLLSTRTEATLLNNQVKVCVFVKTLGFTIDQLTSELIVPPMDYKEHSFNLTNDGNVKAKFTIEHTLSDSQWTVEVSPEAIELQPDETGTIIVRTLTTVGLNYGDTLIVNVTVTSENSGATHYLTFISKAGATYQITMDMLMTETELGPGEVTDLEIIITNTGNAQDNVSLAFTGPIGWTVDFDQPLTTLGPGLYAVRTATVTVPDYAEAALVGEITFTAISEMGAPNMTNTIYVTVLQIYNISMTLGTSGPEVIAPGQTFETDITIQNLGNGEDEISVETQAPNGITATLNKSMVKMSAGQTLVSLKVSAMAIVNPGNYTITVKAISTGDIEVKSSFIIRVIKPDLQLKVTGIPEKTIYSGTMVTFSVEVWNAGDAPVDKALLIFTIGTTEIGRHEFTDLNDSTLKSQTFDWKARSGSWQIIVEIDPDGSVPEMDEDNNKVVEKIIVKRKSTGGDGKDDTLLGPYWMFALVMIVFAVVYLMLKVAIWSRRLKDAAAEGERKRALRTEEATTVEPKDDLEGSPDGDQGSDDDGLGTDTEEVQSEPEPEAKSEPEPETKSEPEPETKSEPEPETKSEPEPETKSEPEPETKSEPEPEPGADDPEVPEAKDDVQEQIDELDNLMKSIKDM